MNDFNKKDIVNGLRNSKASVVFEKQNGDKRVMLCTLIESELPAPVTKIKEKSKRKENEAVVSVWDLEALGWRSFRVDSIESITVLDA